MFLLCFRLFLLLSFFFFFKQKTAYEMRISDWSSDVCSSDLASLTSHETPGESRADSSFSGDYPASRRNDRPNSDVGQWARYDAGSGEALRADLAGYSLSDRDRRLVEYIIDALDEDGYLRVAFRDLANPGQFSPPVDDSEWEAALRLVQHLEPCGLGARSIKECLALQLRALR